MTTYRPVLVHYGNRVWNCISCELMGSKIRVLSTLWLNFFIRSSLETDQRHYIYIYIYNDHNMLQIARLLQHQGSGKKFIDIEKNRRSRWNHPKVSCTCLRRLTGEICGNAFSGNQYRSATYVDLLWSPRKETVLSGSTDFYFAAYESDECRRSNRP